jgi:hypothetical protein
MLNLSWSIEGEEQLVRNLRGIGKEVKDWTGAFREAADKLKNIFSNDVFRTEGGAIGEKWAPLKPQYLAQKVKAGFPADTLIKRGVMKAAFDNDVKKDQATIYNTAPYFKYHQSKDPRSKLPRRIMMKLGNPQKEIVVKIFHTYWYKKTRIK